MEIGKKLKEARENAGLTQDQVAEAIMVSRQTVSNWENSKSLPDIISILKFSDLYKISVDELLKSDKNVQKKIEKDTNIASTNKSVILITTIITLTALTIYFISIFVGGQFNDFCENAMRWVLAGIAITFTITYLRSTSIKNKLKFNKGALTMKKLQIVSIVLLLFAIWISIFPIIPNSKIPGLVAMISAASGLICCIISLFCKDK
ncbi:MAG: helix-turn-helix transcriptional regulator [Clostridiales bacterium]|nr:helix-turn-helix transcriptional regulator [Clostridiales bacterium]